MEASLKIAFLTADDPIYLPAFYDRLLSRWAARTEAVYVVPPLYKRQTPLDAAIRYAKTFGYGATAHLAMRVVWSKLRGQSVAAICRKWKVRCEDIADVNAPDFLERLRRENADVLISVSTPQIYKRPLIELSRFGILSIHGAILPQYRGVMPSFWMMANGEKQAGVSIYFIDEKIDSGERVGLRVFPIDPHETLDQFVRKSKAIAADLLLEVLNGLEQETLNRQPLDLATGSYFSWPDRDAVMRFRSAGRRLW